MKVWFRELDRILRGEATSPSAMALAKGADVPIPAAGISAVILLLAASYGICMGAFTLLNREPLDFRQLAASTLKVPMLFWLTVLVTFPSLYVFNALVGSRLRPASLLRLLIATLAVMTAVLASFGPVVAFFAATTSNHPFMQLLNVAVFAIAGGLGLVFLLRTLHRLTAADRRPVPPASEPADVILEPDARPSAAVPTGALDADAASGTDVRVRTVFRIWIVLFGLVGTQMAWVLSPFIGRPDEPFMWLNPRHSNFFAEVWRALHNVTF